MYLKFSVFSKILLDNYIALSGRNASVKFHENLAFLFWRVYQKLQAVNVGEL